MIIDALGWREGPFWAKEKSPQSHGSQFPSRSFGTQLALVCRIGYHHPLPMAAILFNAALISDRVEFTNAGCKHATSSSRVPEQSRKKELALVKH